VVYEMRISSRTNCAQGYMEINCDMMVYISFSIYPPCLSLTGSLNRSNFVRGRPATMSATRLSKESLAGSGSASHSPSAYDRCSFT
jgi:hypothetical protein